MTEKRVRVRWLRSSHSKKGQSRKCATSEKIAHTAETAEAPRKLQLQVKDSWCSTANRIHFTSSQGTSLQIFSVLKDKTKSIICTEKRVEWKRNGETCDETFMSSLTTASFINKPKKGHMSCFMCATQCWVCSKRKTPAFRQQCLAISIEAATGLIPKSQCATTLSNLIATRHERERERERDPDKEKQ